MNNKNNTYHSFLRLSKAIYLTFISLVLLALVGCQPVRAPLEKEYRQPISVVPVPRMRNYEWMTQSAWYQFHADDLAVAHEGKAELLFIGDSITESWGWNEETEKVFEEYFGEYATGNFGVGGDRTQNVMWRLQNGLKGNLDPSLVVLLIGVNNLLGGGQAPDTVYSGVVATVQQIHENYPRAKVLLLGVFPAGKTADDPNRKKILSLNKMLAAHSFEPYVSFRDIGDVFLNEKGEIPYEYMNDYLHPTALGLKQEAKAIAPLVKSLMESAQSEFKRLSLADKMVNVMGRTVEEQDGRVLLGYPGVTFNFRVKAKQVDLKASSSQGKNVVEYWVDGKSSGKIILPSETKNYTLFKSDQVSTHTIKIVNHSETWHGTTEFRALDIYEGELLPAPNLAEKKLLVIGDSISCGAAIDQAKTADSCQESTLWWNAEETYGMKLGQHFDAQVQLACYGGRGVYRTWQGKTDDLTGVDIVQLALPEISKAYKWPAEKYIPDAVIINLGTNDFSQHAGSPPDKQAFIKKYHELLAYVIGHYPKAKIFLSDGPMVGGEQRLMLRKYIQEAVDTFNTTENVHLTFFSRYASGVCDPHPTAEDHSKMVQDFIPELRRVLAW